MIEINRQGCTRVVFLTKRYAFKIPNFFDGWGHVWRLGLTGMLANQQEYRFSKTKWPELCPIVFYLPLLLVVMPRAVVLSDDEFADIDAQALIKREDYYIPAEPKSNSFGWLNGRIVAIDYGS